MHNALNQFYRFAFTPSMTTFDWATLYIPSMNYYFTCNGERQEKNAIPRCNLSLSILFITNKLYVQCAITSALCPNLIRVKTPAFFIIIVFTSFFSLCSFCRQLYLLHYIQCWMYMVIGHTK